MADKKNKGPLYLTGRAGNFLIRIVISVIAFVFIIAGFFTLWDMYRTELSAFASYDLMKFRPDIEHNAPPYLDDLVKINKDTAAWVTIYGTNIDYPIFQGDTDMEYINKDAYGDYTITGSIFLSVLNKKDFSDPYNLIYGHHMENGSMFGDIDKFKNKKFFYNFKKRRYKTDEGVLIMENKGYDLHVFAFMKANAYDMQVYRPDKPQSEIPSFVQYIKSNSKYYRKTGKIDKILALSTCNGYGTDSRLVLFCNMTLRTEPLPTREAEPLIKHRAQGHKMAGAYWAFLNLAALILGLYAACPLHIYAGRAMDKLGSKKKKKAKNSAGSQNASNSETEKTPQEPKEKKRKNPQKKKVIGFALMIVLCIAAVCFFNLTEDMHKPIQIIDKWTLVMIAFTASVWLIRKWLLKEPVIRKIKIYKRQKTRESSDNREEV